MQLFKYVTLCALFTQADANVQIDIPTSRIDDEIHEDIMKWGEDFFTEKDNTKVFEDYWFTAYKSMLQF